MPIILDTQEAEIRRITVQSQPGKTVHKTLSQKYPTQKSVGEWLKHQYCKKKKKKLYFHHKSYTAAYKNSI
jgi:hypothetical protein